MYFDVFLVCLKGLFNYGNRMRNSQGQQHREAKNNVNYMQYPFRHRTSKAWNHLTIL